MRLMILRQNTFLEEKAIILINWISQKDEQKVMNYFKQSTNFTAMEPTQQSIEWRWILVTTTKTLYNARVETDEIYLDLNISYTISADQ